MVPCIQNYISSLLLDILSQSIKSKLHFKSTNQWYSLALQSIAKGEASLKVIFFAVSVSKKSIKISNTYIMLSFWIDFYM